MSQSTLILQRIGRFSVSLIILAITFTCLPAFAELGESCECPKLECDPCTEEQGVTFYSEKCGPNGARVKSCAKPTCVLIKPTPSQCQTAKTSTTPNRLPAAKSVQTADDPTKRRLAEFKNEMRGRDVGVIEVIKGDAFVKTPAGKKLKIAKGMRVHEKDKIITRLRGHVKIVFDDGNIVNIKPASEIVVEEYEHGKEKRALLNLIKGKVRSKVKQKYNGETSYYRVQTKAAVAGVRGTDFVVEYDDGERSVTKISTIEGVVKFGGKNYEERVDIRGGQAASFIVAANDSDVFSEDEISEFVAKGYMTPVYDLSAAELEELKTRTEVGDPLANRKLASQPVDYICSSPQAKLNQCVWICQNNPKGSERCRTDLPQVNCVRKRCNANGDWAEESRLPASFHTSCEPKGHRVDECDY